MTGTGARIFGGRWTPKGVPAIYTASCPPLAALEVLVHQPEKIAPDPLVLVEIDLPEYCLIKEIPEHALGRFWNCYPYHHSTQKIGEDWAREGTIVALKVPTATMPFGYGWNYILNPNCPHFLHVKVVNITDFKLDGRFFSKLGR